MEIAAKKILNSRKQDTIEISYFNHIGSAPSGISTGKYEAKSYLHNLNEEIQNFNKKYNDLKKFRIDNFNDLEKIEHFLRRFGANTVIALEFAILNYKKGYKWLEGRKLPKPLGNCVGGGMHFKGKSTLIQEFLVIDNNSKTFIDSSFNNMKAHRLIHELLEKEDKNFSNKVNDEGAWVTNLEDEEVLTLMRETCNKLKLDLGIDVAASHFYNGQFYLHDKKKLSKNEQIKYIKKLIDKYNLYYVEDPLHEDDFSGFKELSKECLICGDDLIATNLERLKKAIKEKSINAVIIKPNQIGSLIQVKEVVELAKKNNIIPVISHRSGETLDTSISHLAVGLEIPIIKCGIFGKERQAKINELIKIEKEIT
jgi:enolase